MKAAVILAAGQGLRAWPYCGIRQKVTVPILNVPLIRRLALQLIDTGFSELTVVIGHRGAAVRACLADLAQVRFVELSKVTGPVESTLAGLHDVREKHVLVCSGDIVTTAATLQRFVESFEKSAAIASVLVKPVPDGATRWSSVVRDKTDRLTQVFSTDDRNHPCYAGGIVADTETLRRYLLRNPGIMENCGIGGMPPIESNLEYTLQLMAQDGLEVRAHDAAEFVIDVDKPWDILEANAVASKHVFKNMQRTVVGKGASIDDGAHIDGDAKLLLGPGARIGKGVHIKGSLVLGAEAVVDTGAILGANVTVGGRTQCIEYCRVADGAVLGADGICGHGAEFTGVMFETVYLYHYCEISGLVGSSVDIGAATVCGNWRFDNTKRVQTVNGHKETPPYFGDMTYIGDYTRTGVNVIFMPGVRVGTHCCIGPGAIIQDDVPDKTLLLVKQEQVQKPWGPERYGW